MIKVKFESTIIIILMIGIILIPNLLSYFILSTSNFFSLLGLSLIILFIPVLFLRIKTWLKLLLIPVLLSPFEILTLFTTQSRINNVILASIFNTNKNEATELISGILPAIGLCVITIIAYIFLLRKLKNNNYLSKKIRLSIILFTVGFLFFSFIRIRSNNLKFSENFKQFTYNLKDKFSYKIYPTDLIYNSLIYFREKNNEKRALNNLKDFKFNAKKSGDSARIIVFVIGESSRAANWSLWGYDIETNPRLEKVEGLYTLPDTFSGTNSTYRSLPMLLTRSTPQNQSEWQRSGTIMQLFKESGYSTAWIGGQSKDHVVVHLAVNYADYVNFDLNYDGILLNDAKEFISEKQGDVFVVIHTEGSHYDYKERYPKKFDQFSPSAFVNTSSANKQEVINAYNNSILYTDYLLSDMINFLQNQTRESVLFYTSDHGENLMDDDRNLKFHVQSIPTNYELHVPSLIWLSKSFQENYPENVNSIIENRNKKMSTTVTFSTLADLGGITYPGQSLDVSVSSPSFKEFADRYIVTNLKEILNVDSIKE